MNFYLDFEAIRFSNNIISIGCVADNGATFQTFVKPAKKHKVDRFITELTGITNAMLSNAPSADDAFNAFYDFIIANNNNTAPQYYCYGNSDKDFLTDTLKYMTNTRACICAQAIRGSLIDYADVVKKFFVVKHDLALRKVYMLVQAQKELVQKHDALEDALMLQTVVTRLYDTCEPKDKTTLLSMPSQKRPSTGKKAPPIFNQWNHSEKWTADTFANENSYILKCVDQHSGQIKYFNDFHIAALWVIKYIARNVSPKNDAAVQKIEMAIKSAPQTGKCRYNCHWEYNPEGAIALTTLEEK